MPFEFNAFDDLRLEIAVFITNFIWLVAMTIAH